jgi:hypothetical protein
MSNEITNLLEFYRMIPVFKKHGHNVSPDWIINLKAKLILMLKYGFTLKYRDGYFLWTKKMEEFN